MRSSTSTRLHKAVSLLCAAVLCCGLLPTAALAAPDTAADAAENSLSLIPEGEQGAIPIVSGAEGGDEDAASHAVPDTPASVDGDGAAITSENVTAQEVPLEPVAQQESTRTYFLAQTLENTRTIPVVSANLPLDEGAGEEVTEPEAGEGGEASEDEGGEDSDDPDLGELAPIETTSAVSVESTVIGSFTTDGMTYAVEPGGETVALVAVDYAKLPQTFIEKQVIIVPGAVTPDGVDYYSVTRIADYAFAGLTQENADPAYTGCKALFEDEELLAEAEVDPADCADLVADEPGILIASLPASVTTVEEDAFAGADTLQYILADAEKANALSPAAAKTGIALLNAEESDFGASLDRVLHEQSHRIASLTDINTGLDLSFRTAYAASVPANITITQPTCTKYAKMCSSTSCPSFSATSGSPIYMNETLTVAKGALVWDCPNGLGVVFSKFLRANGYSSSAWSACHFTQMTINGKICTTASQAVAASNPTYSITWNANGGTGGGTTTENSGATHTAKAASRTGYTFAGWYTAASGGTQVAANGSVTNVTANATYYAHWTANTYTVVYNGNHTGPDGTNDFTGSTASSSHTYGTAKNLTANGFSVPGYNFSKWTTAANGTGTSYTDKQSVNNLTSTNKGTVNLYAQWTAKTITVTWNGSGGTWGASPTTTTTKAYGPTATVPLPTTEPVREGYVRTGWFTAEGDEVTAETALPTTNPTYYADWEIGKWTVTWKNSEWANERNETIEYAQPITWATPGTKPAHIFVGWQADGADTTLYEPDEDGNFPAFLMKAGDVTFTAVWEAAYIVNFTMDDQRYVDSIQVNGTAMKSTVILPKNDTLATGITVQGVNVNPDYYDPAYGFKRFVVNGVDLTSRGWTYENGSSWTRDAFTLNSETVGAYFPNDADRIYIRIEFNNAPFTPDGDTVERDPVKHYQAKLILDGGSIPESATGTWQGATPTYSFTHLSESVNLPTPTKAGYTFTGWSGIYDDTAHRNQDPNCILVAKGSVWSRTYTANWAPKTGSVEFSYNAAEPDEGYVGVPDAQPVTFNSAMPSVGTDVPTRPGFRFVGFFDTTAAEGGRMYYTSELASARSWDKNLGEDEAFTLYARWVAVPDADHTRVVTANNGSHSRGVMSAMPHEGAAGAGAALTVFDGTYLGTYAWESYDASATKPASTEAVTIDVSSYTYNSGFNVKGLPKQFDYTEGSGSGAQQQRLLGFKAGSGADATFIPFTTLLNNDHFRLNLRGSELELTGSGTTPADFRVPAASVEPVYTTGYPGYDLDENGEVVWPKQTSDTLTSGDKVTTVFDAAPGTFASGSAIATTETIYNNPVELPGVPSRAGYKFEGWSLASTHTATNCDCKTANLDRPTSKVPRVFKAHWSALTYDVYYVDSSLGGTAHAATAVYGQPLPAVGDAGGAPEPATREGFMGYFDSQTTGGVCYLDAGGAPVRSWDKTENSPVYLYAQWATSEGPVDPVKPTPENPDLQNPPFPGVEEPWQTVVTDHEDESASFVKMPVNNELNTASANLFAGLYQGSLSFTDKSEAGKPADATDHVKLTVYSYTPDADKTAREAFEEVRRTFEAPSVAPGATPYLQGFKVVSTGWSISLADLLEGRSVAVQCLGADLDWMAVRDGSTTVVQPASAVFKPGKVVAVYSASPVIDPGRNWPTTGDATATPAVPATQVFNQFDAYCGRFPVTNGTTLTTERMRTVASDWQGKLKLPAAPRYDFEGHEFIGWFLADGTQVDENTTVTWKHGQTIHARYRQVVFTLTFMHDNDTSQTFAPLANVWNGQDPASLRGEFQQRTPALAGYDFVGWAAFPNGLNDQRAAIPYYLVTTDGWDGNPVAKAVTGNVELHPLWSGRTYTITWRYNHGTAFANHNKEPFKTETVFYGAEYDALPAPENPRYAFYGWYPTQVEAGNATANRNNADIIGADKWFQWSDTKSKYVFAPPTAIDTTDDLTFWAGWNKTDPVQYNVKLHAGTGPNPTFGGADTSVTERTVNVSFDAQHPGAKVNLMDVEYIPYMNLAGWTFTGWRSGTSADGAFFPEGSKLELELGSGNYEFTAQWSVAEAGAYSIAFQKGEAVSGASPLDTVDWRFLSEGTYLDATSVMQKFDAAAGTVRVPQFLSMSTPGYTFTGWQRLERSQSGAWEPVTSTSADAFATIPAGMQSFEAQDLVQKATKAGSNALVFRAVWEPKRFEVRYFMEKAQEDGTKVPVRMEMTDVEEKDWNNVSYEGEITLPQPAFKNIGSIFERWDRKDASVASGDAGALKPGMTKTIRDIVAKVGPGSIEDGVSVADGGNGLQILNLYGASTEGMSFTVPLEVNVRFDLERPEEAMIVGQAKVTTTQSKPVEVKTIEVLREGTDDTLALTGQSDGGQYVNLLVQGYRDAEGSDLKKDGYLAINMGQRNAGARYHASDLASHGFGTLKAGQPLNLDYRLEFLFPTEGALTPSSYARLLGVRDKKAADGTYATVPIAKLFYTVGLA